MWAAKPPIGRLIGEIQSLHLYREWAATSSPSWRRALAGHPETPRDDSSWAVAGGAGGNAGTQRESSRYSWSSAIGRLDNDEDFADAQNDVRVWLRPKAALGIAVAASQARVLDIG